MKYVLTIFLFTISLSCFCQNNWVPGYIIKIHGDTVYGFIDSRNNSSNSKKCFFKADKKSKSQEFTPEELIGYRIIDGMFFVSKKITTSADLNKSMFLEFLLSGKVNLYHFEDTRHHYFVEKDGQIFELKNTVDAQTLNEKNEYIGILTYLLQDGITQSEIIETMLDTKNLIDLTEKYHDKVCKDEKCIIYTKKLNPIKFILRLHTGVSLNKIRYGYIESNYGLGGVFGITLESENLFLYNNNFSLMFGANLQSFSKYILTINKDFNNTYYTTIAYNNSYYSIYDVNTYIPTGGITSLAVNLKTLMLKTPVILNYTFSRGRMRPFIGAGVFSMLNLTPNSRNMILPILELGILGRIGFEKMLNNNHFISFEVDYESSLGNIKNLFSTSIGYTL